MSIVDCEYNIWIISLLVKSNDYFYMRNAHMIDYIHMDHIVKNYNEVYVPYAIAYKKKDMDRFIMERDCESTCKIEKRLVSDFTLTTTKIGDFVNDAVLREMYITHNKTIMVTCAEFLFWSYDASVFLRSNIFNAKIKEPCFLSLIGLLNDNLDKIVDDLQLLRMMKFIREAYIITESIDMEYRKDTVFDALKLFQYLFYPTFGLGGES